MAKSPNWSQEEIAFLTEFYPSMGIKWCASRLPLRTENSVNAAAYTLGIRKEEPRKFIRYFKNIDTEEKAYWLGFLFADGCVSDFKERKTNTRVWLEIERVPKKEGGLDATK